MPTSRTCKSNEIGRLKSTSCVLFCPLWYVAISRLWELSLPLVVETLNLLGISHFHLTDPSLWIFETHIETSSIPVFHRSCVEIWEWCTKQWNSSSRARWDEAIFIIGAKGCQNAAWVFIGSRSLHSKVNGSPHNGMDWSSYQIRLVWIFTKWGSPRLRDAGFVWLGFALLERCYFTFVHSASLPTKGGCCSLLSIMSVWFIPVETQGCFGLHLPYFSSILPFQPQSSLQFTFLSKSPTQQQILTCRLEEWME